MIDSFVIFVSLVPKNKNFLDYRKKEIVARPQNSITDIARIIETTKVTLTDRVLYFPCLASRPQVEYLPYHIYENSDWLVLPFYGSEAIEHRFLEGVLTLRCPEQLPNRPKIYREHRDLIETRVLEILDASPDFRRR